MHVATGDGLLPGQEQEHVAGPGRPSKHQSWGTHDSPHGRDPLAIKALGKSLSTDKSPLQHNYRGGSPLSTENIQINSLIDSMKSSNVIKQTLLNETQDKDSGTMLDESQLINE